MVDGVEAKVPAGGLLFLRREAQELQADTMVAENVGGLLEGGGVEGGSVGKVAAVGEEGTLNGRVDQGELVAGLGKVAVGGAGDLEDTVVGVGLLRVLLRQGGGAGVGGGRGASRGGRARAGVKAVLPRAEVLLGGRSRWAAAGLGGRRGRKSSGVGASKGA